MLLLCALIVGSSNVWAVTYSLTPDQTSTGSSATSYITTLTEFTYGGVSWKMNQWNPSTLQVKTNQSSASSEFRFYNTSAFEGRITKVVISFSALGLKDTDNSGFMFVGGTSEISTTTGGTQGIWNSTDKTLTWEPGVSDNFTFFAVYQNGKVATGSNYLASSNAIVVTYEEASTKTATTTTIDYSGISNTAVNTSTSAGSLSASVTVTSGGAAVAGATVTWESSDEGVAIVASDGTVTLVAAGSTTITASYAGNETYKASSDTYDLTVSDSRMACGLDYVETYQQVKVGDVLDAPTLTNPNSLDVTYTSGDETIATVDASGNVTGVKIGVTTITATFAGNSLYSAGSASYTINVKRATPAGELFYEGLTGYTSTNDGSSNLTNTYANLDSDDWKSFSYVYAGKVLSGDADGHLKFGSSSYAGTAETNSIALTGSGKLTYKVQQYDSKNAGKLTISVTGATATGDLDVTGTAAWVEKTVYLTEATGSVVITFATNSEDKRIRVDDITVTQVTTAPATISTAEYATFVHPAFDLDFSTTGITVYTATDNENSVTLNEVASGQVPANTPVVLYKAGADGSAIDVPVIASADAIGGTNDLHVSTGTDVANMYVLAKKTAGVGFYPWEGSTDLSAGKIYLQGKASYGAREFLGFANGSATTAINNAQFTNTNEANTPVYNLNGQRVAQPTRGLYIVNGKKVIIK